MHYFDIHTNLNIGYDMCHGQPSVNLNTTYDMDTKKIPTHKEFGLRSESALISYLENILFDFLDNEIDEYNGDIQYDSMEVNSWSLRNY